MTEQSECKHANVIEYFGGEANRRCVDCLLIFTEPETVTEIRENGNRMLSSMDMQLWGMVYSVALQWQTQIMFKWQSMHVPKKRDEIIWFFVPKDSVHRYEIIKFLQGHLDKLQREPATFALEGGEEDHYFPGCQCEIRTVIFTFNGVQPEFPVEVSEAMSKGFMQRIMLELGSPKRKERIVEKAREKLKSDPGFVDTLLGSVSASRLEEILAKDD